ncbi:MAP1S protein, partial [Atractosteus spatula]|nr:MAP1S protein [Atractosteus spatula]
SLGELPNMATEQAGDMEGADSPVRAAHPGFSNDKYSLLVVVGEHSRPGLLEYVVSEIERDRELRSCPKTFACCRPGRAVVFRNCTQERHTHSVVRACSLRTGRLRPFLGRAVGTTGLTSRGAAAFFQEELISRDVAFAQDPWPPKLATPKIGVAVKLRMGFLPKGMTHWTGAGVRPYARVCGWNVGVTGIRSWDVDLTACNLDEQLKLFVSRHSATFSEEVKASLLLCPSQVKTLGGVYSTPWSQTSQGCNGLKPAEAAGPLNMPPLNPCKTLLPD